MQCRKIQWDLLHPLETAKVWLDECVASHAGCHSRREFDAPTRLLSIGNQKVKLVLTERMKNRPPYGTLSYCWGTDPFLMLTSKTLNSFPGNIVEAELPKTFQDAILMARSLGLSYIWIDALCIIQNDDDDWLREAGRMRSIYGGSRVSIAAISALNAHQGCFNKPKYQSSGFYARITTKSHSRMQAFFTVDLHEEYISGPLARRAWALQERMLPPRTLSCGAQGLLWECRCATRSEFLPNELPGAGIGNIPYRLICPESHAPQWLEVVEQYSRAKLTHGSDRLPAFPGIATRHHEVTGDQYPAGMWRAGLLFQLTWHIRDPAERRDRPAWRAPTWSWASVDGPVTYLSTLCTNWEAHTRILDAWTTRSGPDSFGPVSGGVLTLGCAWLLCGPLDYENKYVTFGASGPEVKHPENTTMTVPVVIDCLSDGPGWDQNLVYLLPLIMVTGSRYQTRPVPGVASQTGKPEVRDITEVVGIILQRRGSTRGHFRRMGYFTMDDWIPPDKWAYDQGGGYGDFLRLIQRVGPGAAEAECAKVLSDEDLSNSGPGKRGGDTKPRYVITIE